MMKLNPEMVILGREFRGLSQTELAEKSGITQPRVARIEAGIGADLSAREVERIGEALGFPVGFFSLDERRYSFGTSSVFTRTRRMTAGEKKLLSGTVNVQRIHIKKMLDHVDVQSSRPLPRFYLDEFPSVEAVAATLRETWRLPRGPISNITKLIEGAGVLIVESDFREVPMDATTIVLEDIPPVIFINKNVPGDRWRFTLAHELAHLVMHDMPIPTMEDEADAFAAEFLVPSEEIAPELSRLNATRLESYIALKNYWRVSIACLIRKALTLGKITPDQSKSLIIQMQRLGIRKHEPAAVPRESTNLFPSLIEHFRSGAAFTAEEFARTVHYLPERLGELYDWNASDARPRLRVIK